MGCSDRTVLQRLLDGELDQLQARRVSRHVESCRICQAATADLDAVRAFVQEHLGAEDETEEDAAASTLLAVGRQVSQYEPTRGQPALRWLTRRWITAAAVTIALALPLAFGSGVGANADLILLEAQARDRMWKYQPHKALRWQVDVLSTGVKTAADGRWQSLYWQKNDASSFAQIWRQFDPARQLFRAAWRQEDGTTINYRPDLIEILPSAATARAALPTLPLELRTALEAYLDRGEAMRSLDFNSRREAGWLNAPAIGSARGHARLERGWLDGWGEVYRITRVNDPNTGGPGIVRSVHEYEVEKATFRLLRLVSTITYADGSTGVHDSRWTGFTEISAEEFDRQVPHELLDGTVPIVHLTAHDVAVRHFEQLRRARQRAR